LARRTTRSWDAFARSIALKQGSKVANIDGLVEPLKGYWLRTRARSIRRKYDCLSRSIRHRSRARLKTTALPVEPLANASGCRAREGERHQLRHHRSVSGAGFQRRGFSAFRPLLGFRRSGRVDLLPSARAASDDTQRDAIYRRNIDPGERVVASLLQFRPDSEALGHWCRLEREQDGSIIAEVLTVRALATSR
jgi:hypothetical protein